MKAKRNKRFQTETTNSPACSSTSVEEGERPAAAPSSPLTASRAGAGGDATPPSDLQPSVAVASALSTTAAPAQPPPAEATAVAAPTAGPSPAPPAEGGRRSRAPAWSPPSLPSPTAVLGVSTLPAAPTATADNTDGLSPSFARGRGAPRPSSFSFWCCGGESSDPPAVTTPSTPARPSAPPPPSERTAVVDAPSAVGFPAGADGAGGSPIAGEIWGCLLPSLASSAGSEVTIKSACGGSGRG